MYHEWERSRGVWGLRCLHWLGLDRMWLVSSCCTCLVKRRTQKQGTQVHVESCNPHEDRRKQKLSSSIITLKGPGCPSVGERLKQDGLLARRCYGRARVQVFQNSPEVVVRFTYSENEGQGGVVARASGGGSVSVKGQHEVLVGTQGFLLGVVSLCRL